MTTNASNPTKTLAGHYVFEMFQDARQIATSITGLPPSEQTVLQVADMILRVAEQQQEGAL
jgi:hypothetical protein